MNDDTGPGASDLAEQLLAQRFGQRLRSLREKSQLSTRALAARAGISQPYLSQLERGLSSPSMVTTYRLAEALGVLVALIKIADYATVIPGLALFTLGALVFVLAAMQASFDPREVWKRVRWASAQTQTESAAVSGVKWPT